MIPVFGYWVLGDTRQYCVVLVSGRDVHRNGKDWDPMGPMGFPREWEYDKPWVGSSMGMGIKCMGMGFKTWEWEKITAYCN